MSSEIIIKKDGPMGDERHKHESYGMLGSVVSLVAVLICMGQVLNTTTKYSLL